MIVFLVAALLSLHADPPALCTRLLPGRLMHILEKIYPSYELARKTEEPAPGVENDVPSCRGNAIDDFDGDGQQDYGVLLRRKGESAVRVVVALNRGRRYKVRTLGEWDGEPSDQYIDVIEPGEYESIETDTAEPGEVSEISSRYPGVITGTEESSGVAYFYKEGKWVHLWLSD